MGLGTCFTSISINSLGFDVFVLNLLDSVFPSEATIFQYLANSSCWQMQTFLLESPV
ncbi:MAG: hypothetical protein ACI83D_000236 [Planctomycetota bacterium]|jgi:hypothetical protein